MIKFRKAAFASTASSLALIIALPAYAQSATAPAPQSTASAPTTDQTGAAPPVAEQVQGTAQTTGQAQADPPGDTAVQPEGLQDIIVTAQRRGENLQRVPISVSAVTADMAQAMGIEGTQDLPIAAPALTFSPTSSGAAITIRGVGSSGLAVDETGNAVYIDGVYQAAAQAYIFALNNVDRVEVLKGPQGTLFGRNATGGLIQIITKRPQNEFGADLSIGYANYKTVETQAYLTGPIANGLAADFAIYNLYQGEGWGENIRTGRDAYRGRNFAARTKLLWEISDRTDVTLMGSYADIEPTASQGGGILPGEVSRSAGGVAGSGNVGFFNLNQDRPSTARVKQSATSLTINHDFEWARLLNITAYTHTRQRFFQDADIGPANFSNLDITFPVKTFSQELQLQTPSTSRIQASIGLYYFYNRVAHDPFNLTGLQFGSTAAFIRTEVRQKTNSYAAYGQVTVPVLDGTNVTAGLRYTIDERNARGTVTNLAGVTAFNADAEEKKLTYRLSVDQELGERTIAYASFNTGFKGGLFNISSPAQPPVVAQEIDAYEIGIKSQFLNNRVRLNVAAFYYNFDNIQIRATNAQGVPLLTNAASARQKGVDVDIAVSPLQGLDLSAGIAYLDSTFRSFERAPFFTVNPAGGLIGSTGNASGNRTTYSPEWVATFVASYRIPSSSGDVTLSTTVNYNDGFFYEPQNRVSSGSFTLVNPSISWTPDNGPLEIRAWARNLADERYYASVGTGAVGDQYYPGAPRTYGATLRYRFS